MTTLVQRRCLSAQYLWGVVGRCHDHEADKCACRNTGRVHDSGNWHLNLETLVGCLGRIHQDVPKMRDPKHLLTNRVYGTSGTSCSRWTCGLAFSMARPRPSFRVCLHRANTAPRPLNRPARCRRRFPGRLPRSPRTRPCPAPGSMTLFLRLLP